MTGFLDLLLDLMAWRFVLVRARVVVCLLRCWRKCRGFAQLREGSDRRETRCMKPKPLHQTPSGIKTACLIKFFLSESRAVCQCQPCIGLQEPWRKPAVFSTSPAFHPTTRFADNTHTLEPAVRRQRVRQLTLRNYARTGRTGGGQACPGGKPCCLPCCVHLPSWAETREVCLYPHRQKCGGGAGGKCRLSWGLSLD